VRLIYPFILLIAEPDYSISSFEKRTIPQAHLLGMGGITVVDPAFEDDV